MRNSDQKLASILLWIVTVHMYICAYTCVYAYKHKGRKLSSGKILCVCVCIYTCTHRFLPELNFLPLAHI